MYCNKSSLIVIAGPTASGKSSLAMALAQRWSGVILSADSRQVYRNFDIGTAKPSHQDQSQIKHYFIDSCEPTETLTVADYQQQAQQIIAQLHQESKYQPFLVGGTGLYINAIARGLKIPRVAPNHALRHQLSTHGQPICHQILQQVDPAAARRIHPNDQVRTLRALEVFYTTGHSITSQQGEDAPSYPILYIGLACDPDALRQRITQRTHQMIEAGLINEVERLISHYGVDLPLLKTLGYAEIQQYLTGEISKNRAIELIIQHTCQFAKRQRTWFQKDPHIEWFAAAAPDLDHQVCQRIEAFMNGVNKT